MKLPRPAETNVRVRSVALRSFSRRTALFAAALVLALGGCALVNDEEFAPGGDVAMSPLAVLVPRRQVLSSAEAVADQHSAAFVFFHDTDEMLPRYTRGTALVVERTEYRDLRRGMTVVFVSGTHRVAHALVMRAADGWVTRAFNLPHDDPDFMTEANYLGSVVMAFAPEPAAGAH